MTDRQEMNDRNRIRRQMALAAMVLIWIICLAFLWGLGSDQIAGRVEKVWPPFVIIIPVLVAQIMQYVHVGAQENKAMMEKE